MLLLNRTQGVALGWYAKPRWGSGRGSGRGSGWGSGRGSGWGSGWGLGWGLGWGSGSKMTWNAHDLTNGGTYRRYLLAAPIGGTYWRHLSAAPIGRTYALKGPRIPAQGNALGNAIPPIPAF